MQVILYAVKDTKAGVFLQPWSAINDGTAVRQFEQAVNQKSDNNQIYKWPEDHVLFRIGTWDDVTGAITGDEAPSRIALASQFVLNRMEAANG